MKFHGYALVSATACMMLLATGAVQAEEDTKARQQLDQLRQDYVQAAQSGDSDRVAAFYTEDAVVMAPFQPATTGRRNILTSFREMGDKYRQTMSLTSEELQVLGDWAVDRGAITITNSPKDGGGEATTFNGKYMAVLKQDTEGNWKIARVIYNHNERPPASMFQTE